MREDWLLALVRAATNAPPLLAPAPAAVVVVVTVNTTVASRRARRARRVAGLSVTAELGTLAAPATVDVNAA